MPYNLDLFMAGRPGTSAAAESAQFTKHMTAFEQKDPKYRIDSREIAQNR